MRNFILSSFILLCLSCSTKPAFDSGTTKKVLSTDLYKFPLSSGRPSYFFKTKADIYGHYLSGLLLIKPVSESDYRIVFTNEMGIKFFDFELTPDKFIVHYCIDKLNRKIVVKTLEKDFRLALMMGVAGQEAYYKEETNSLVFTLKKDKEWNRYFISRETSRLTKIEDLSGQGKSKVEMNFENYEKEFPQTIKIIHHNIKLNIELNFIER